MYIILAGWARVQECLYYRIKLANLGSILYVLINAIFSGYTVYKVLYHHNTDTVSRVIFLRILVEDGVYRVDRCIIVWSTVGATHYTAVGV